MQSCITIIVPVYNVEDYLDRCIHSIMNQTYSNLEIILVDDGSTDHSGELCDRYREQDSRIKVIHKTNGGLSSARNAALEIMTGDYVGFVDSDDYIHLNMFEKLMKAIEENHSEIAVCNHYVEEGNKIHIKAPIKDQAENMSKTEALKLLIEDFYIKNYAWDKLYKASLFENVRYPDGRNYEDIATTYLVFDRAETITKIPDYLYYYQIRENSISYGNSDRKWYNNCKAIVTSRTEVFQYFKNKGEGELAKRAFAKLLPYIYETIQYAYKLGEKQEIKKYKKELLEFQNEVMENEYIAYKDKNAFKKYVGNYFAVGIYLKVKNPLKKDLAYVRRVKNKFFLQVGKEIDFSLKEGKSIRVIFFELPCFDNLGDHAIAYAQKKYLENLEKLHDSIQVYVVDGWDTISAIVQLKKVITPKDIIVCQGGGNFGNLYMFAEGYRRKLFEQFPKNKIIVFPQTFYYTDDENGKRELHKSSKLINKCEDITLLARDHMSYEAMKKNFHANVMEMNDIVSYLDESKYASDSREGLVLCLRSDKESALKAEDKNALLECCEKAAQVLVTDTVLQREVTMEMREQELIKKWETFGKARLVVTDRLHGMIFSLITKTPCIILGNNHHKVLETYKTFQKSEYLYFAEDIQTACAMIERYKEIELPQEKTSFEERFGALNEYLSQLIGD